MGTVECADKNYVCTANKELILDSSRAVQIIVRKASIVRGPKPLNGGGEPFVKALGTVELGVGTVDQTGVMIFDQHRLKANEFSREFPGRPSDVAPTDRCRVAPIGYLAVRRSWRRVNHRQREYDQ